MHDCPAFDQVTAYALHQLTAEEVSAIKAHLSTCTACRLKLSEIRETVDLLPLAMGPGSEPPPGLKGRILEAARQEQQGRRRKVSLPLWAAVAASIALVIGTYSLIRTRELNQRVADFEKTKTERAVAMVGTDAARGARGRVLLAPEGSGTRVVMQLEGLPALSQGEAYQLWLIKDGKRTNGGVFVVDATGKGGAATWLAGSAEFDALGITKEPDALGQQPRGPKMMGSAI